MAGNYVGVNALARSGEAWPSVRLSSTLHANFWWNYFLRKNRFSLLSETWPTPESRYVSPIIIVSESSNWNHFSEEIKSNRNIDRSWIRMRSNAYYVRITFESSNITKFLDFHNSLRNFSTKHADKVAHCDQVGNAS